MGSVAHMDATCITVGVDTHRDTHVAVALDGVGRMVGPKSVAATPDGYREIVAWAQSLGVVEAWGVEGTGSYGAGLTRHLVSVGQVVKEVLRPKRVTRRHKGKSDPVDAEAAARAVLAGVACGIPKAADGPVEMIRVLQIPRSSAMKQRTQTLNNMRSLVVTAPDELRESLRKLSIPRLVAACCAFRPGKPTSLTAVVKFSLGGLAGRYRELDKEIKALDRELAPLTVQASPALSELHGVGPQVSAALLVAAGDNPDRMHSEGAFAALCGVSPIEASSGQTVRHRLNRGGDRQANSALWRIVIVRIGTDDRTKAYVARRIEEGKSKKEAIRCLKRYVANEVFAALTASSSDVPKAA
jgi:transposase